MQILTKLSKQVIKRMQRNCEVSKQFRIGNLSWFKKIYLIRSMVLPPLLFLEPRSFLEPVGEVGFRCRV